MAEGARGPRHRGARRVRRVRARRGAGPERPSTGSSSPRRRRSRTAMGEVAGIEVMVCRTGLHRRDRASSCSARPRTGRRSGTPSSSAASSPCGLGARDTLRLEVCYPLHGNDITQETDAISAGLGVDVRARQGLHRRRRPPAREGRRPRAAARRVRDGGDGDPAPGDADRGRRRGDVRDAFTFPRRRDRHGVRARAAQAAPESELVIDVRGKPRRARVVKKPIYRKET